MVALTECEYRHEKGVPRAATRRIRLTPESVASRIDQESAMLEHDNFCYATDEKTTERADPTVPQKPCQGWQDEADRHCEEMNMAILPHDQRILL